MPSIFHQRPDQFFDSFTILAWTANYHAYDSTGICYWRLQNFHFSSIRRLGLYHQVCSFIKITSEVMYSEPIMLATGSELYENGRNISLPLFWSINTLKQCRDVWTGMIMIHACCWPTMEDYLAVVTFNGEQISFWFKVSITWMHK